MQYELEGQYENNAWLGHKPDDTYILLCRAGTEDHR